MRLVPLLLCLLMAACGDKARRVERAPGQYKVRFETSKGNFDVEAVRAWSPLGVDRFHQLISERFYDEARFFRVLPAFVVQFGIPADPQVAARWQKQVMADDQVTQGNTRGFLSYATDGPSTRTTQVFINLADNRRLDARGFSPFARVVAGMEVVDRFYSGYGEGAPRGAGPDQALIEKEGNSYLVRQYPKLDYIRRAYLLP